MPFTIVQLALAVISRVAIEQLLIITIFVSHELDFLFVKDYCQEYMYTRNVLGKHKWRAS